MRSCVLLAINNFQNAVVHAVGDVERAVAVDVDAVRLVEFGFKRRTADSAGPFAAAARNANDLAFGG